MFGDGALTFQEFARREPFPLATIHDEILFGFLPGRKDAVLCGAQAVNAYVDESRMTQDVDIASIRAAESAEELRRFLSERFPITVLIRTMRERVGYRVFQERDPKNRHLADVRLVKRLPLTKRVKKALVLAPSELIAHKLRSMVGRQGRPKSMSDKADLYRLLLAFPQLKTEGGPVMERLHAADPTPPVLAAWHALVAEDIQPADEDDKFRR